MDNCLQPVLTAAWQKHRRALFGWDKKKLSPFFYIYQLTKPWRRSRSCSHFHHLPACTIPTRPGTGSVRKINPDR
ncbi:hypothetical protein FDX19_21700 [Citrobacter sp. wls619]|nr:hypothetical protein FDX19_21700 [Citrobacter sp. wls619]